MQALRLMLVMGIAGIVLWAVALSVSVPTAIEPAGAEGPGAVQREPRVLPSPVGASETRTGSLRVIAGPPAGQTRLVVKLIEPDGGPAVGEPIELSWEGCEASLTGVTDRAGSVGWSPPADLDLALRFGGGEWARERRELVPLAAGERSVVGPVRLMPGARVTGIVIDEAGRPVENAQVELSPFRSPVEYVRAPRRPAAPPLSTRTGREGRFTLQGLSRGLHRLSIRSSGYLDSHHDLTLRPAETRQTRVRLATVPRLGGRVFDGQGRPVEGARVAVVEDGPISIAKATRALVETGRQTGPDGRFVLDPTEQGPYHLIATAPGHLLSYLPLPLPRDGDEIEVQLVPAAGIRVRVVDSSGRRITGARVFFTPESDRGLPILFDGRGVTDEDGEFAARQLPPGSYRLRVLAAAGTLEREGLRVPADPDLLEVALGGGGEPALSVRLVDEGGDPLGGVQMVLQPLGAQVLTDSGGARFGRTSGEGRLEFFDLGPGRWELTTRPLGYPPGLAPMTRVLHLPATSRLELVARTAATLRIDLATPGGIPLGGVELALLSLEVDASSSPVLRRTDASGRAIWGELPSGRYSLFLGGDPGGGAGGEIHVIEVPGGRTSLFQLVLRSAPTLGLRVVAQGRPLAGASVVLVSDADPVQLMQALLKGEGAYTTDGDGRALLTAPRPGSYIVSARASFASPPQLTRVDLSQGVQDLVVDLSGGTIEGRVAAAPPVGERAPPGGGRAGDSIVRLTPLAGPLEGCRVGMRFSSLDDSRPDPSPQTLFFRGAEVLHRPRGDGSFTIPDVPPGQYQVSLWTGPSPPAQSQVVSVEAGSRVDLGEIPLPQVEGAGAEVISR